MGKNNSKSRKELRRKAARDRQEHWDNLTNFEKVSKLEERNYGDSAEAAKYRQKIFD